ncbi:hypothetical protein D9619_007410 [Psilocybe cf. subviscida]|uniref:DUF427 domain-containing protein n=1 Tax=Psilocybe cf. subviscida TaxID=2480587 RepID=A0A8H5B1V5_9AGAR|nr:hypothetical protein D9619_007410 [Psilocybe cf. subviscida]
MMRVLLDGHLLAQSNDTIVVENNHYFPPDSVRTALLEKSDTSSVCPWKGTAHYYNAVVNGKKVSDVAWYYPETITDRAKHIEGYVAFYKNKVDIQSSSV